MEANSGQDHQGTVLKGRLRAPRAGGDDGSPRRGGGHADSLDLGDRGPSRMRKFLG